MATFDNSSFEPETPPSQTSPEKFSPTSFEPEVSTSTPATPKSFDASSFEPETSGYEAVQKTMQRPASESPALVSERVTDQEIQAVAKHHGVDPEKLKSIAPLWGGITEGIEQDPKAIGLYSLGTAGRVVGLGGPQWIAKKLQDDPHLRDAIDDVRELADRKRSWLAFGAEGLSQLATGGGRATAESVLGQTAEKTAEPLAKTIAHGAVTGGGAGVAGSREGEEATGAAYGAAAGGALSGIAGGIARTLARKSGGELTAADQDAVQYFAKNQTRIEDGTDKLLADRQPAEEILKDKVLQGKNEYVDTDGADAVVEHLAPPELRTANSEASQISRGTSADLLDRVPAEAAEDVDRQKIASGIIEDRTRDFAKELTGEKPEDYASARQAIADFSEKHGDDYVSRQYDQFLRQQTAIDYIHQNELEMPPEGYKPLRVGSNAVSASKFVLRQIGEKHGLDLEGIHNDLSENYNRMAFQKAHQMDELGDLNKLARQAGIDLSTEGHVGTYEGDTSIYDALERGNLEALPDQEKLVAEKLGSMFQDIQDSARKPADSSLSPVATRPGLPQMVVGPEEFIRAVRQEMPIFLDAASEATGRQIEKITDLTPRELGILRKNSSTADEYLRGLELFSEGPLTTPQGAQNALTKAVSPFAARPRLEEIAKSVDTGGIPDFLREKNLLKLYDRFSSSVLRQQYLSEGIAQLGNKQKLLGKIGDLTSANYVGRLRDSISGAQQKTSSEVYRQAALQYTTTLDRVADRVGRNSLQGRTILAAKAAPDLLGALANNLMPNLLGLAPKPLVMHASQSFTKLAPELGGTYGVPTVAKAMLGTVMNMKSLARRLEEGGYIAPEFRGEHLDALEKGIQQSSITRLPADALRGAARFAMYFRGKLDQMNRMIALQTSDLFTHDLLIAKNPAAFAALRQAPTDIQRAVQQGLATGDARLVGKAIAGHLISSTQYHYNKLNMSEFGRVMGPAFSAFSTWPTSTYGDIAADVQSRGWLKSVPRLAGKYAAPWIALEGLDHLMKPTLQSAGVSDDTYKKIFGRRGLGGTAPIESLGGVLTGDVFTPPMIQAAWSSVAVPALRGDFPKMENGMASAVQNFMPGGFMVRFLTDDLVTYGTGQRPQGNFFDRTLEGAQRLSK